MGPATTWEPWAWARLGLGFGFPEGKVEAVAFTGCFDPGPQDVVGKHDCYLSYPLGPYTDEVALKF